MRTLHSLLVVAALSWCISGVPAQAQADARGDIDIYKHVWCDEGSANYGIEFEAWADTDQRLKKVKILVPGKGAIKLVNSPRINDFEFFLLADGLTESQLQNRFPSGKYKIKLTPEEMGKIAVKVVHEFPALPVITDPCRLHAALIFQNTSVDFFEMLRRIFS